MSAVTTAAPDDEPTCGSCDATAAGCRLKAFVGGRPCCPSCSHDLIEEG